MGDIYRFTSTMIETATILLVVLAGLAAIFAFLAFLRVGRGGRDVQLTQEQVSQLLRTEADRIRQSGDEQARGLRQELGDNLRGFQETTLKAFRELGDALGNQVKDFGGRLDLGVKAIDERAGSIGTKLDQDISRMGEEAMRNREMLRQMIEVKLDNASAIQIAAAQALREEMTTSFQRLGLNVAETLTQVGAHQKERLDNVTTALSTLTERQDRAQELLKHAVETRLDTIRTENATKLEEMRKTVDEQLQATLNDRITSSFRLVHDQLEQVYRGLGEMQKLADGVGDLKRVLTNVKTRGVFGEVQLASLIEQMFSPDQYLENAQVRENSQERVEFAVKLPGRSGEGDVLIPIDAKFPIDDYERILQAAERSDVAAIEAAAQQLETTISIFARDIGSKYVNPPTTTDFAILFLPIEGLYAEVLRRRGLIEALYERHRVVICGPTNLLAMLNAFRMSIRAVAIQQRSTEVWQILGAARSEFDKHGVVLGKLQRQLEASLNTVDTLGTRTRAMKRKLQGVDAIGADKIEQVLGLPAPSEENDLEDAAEQP